MADALRTVLTRRGVAADMAAKASQATEGVLWPAVARQYRALAERLILAGVAA